jgi:plastocyanin
MEVRMSRNMVLCGAMAAAFVAFATRAVAYEAVAVADGGSISGTVKYDGTPPAPAKIPVTKDPEVCGKEGKEKVSPDLTVGAGGGVANVVVVVKAAKGKKLEVPTTNPVFDQKTCEFHPHVLAFPAGSTVDVLNSDGILHNIHTTSKDNPSVNMAQPKFKPKIQIKVDKPEWPIKVQCDAHGWMHAYWISQEHPYYAVTGADGSFKIADLPAGDYEVEVWQEKLGKKTEKVSVKAKEDTKVAWTLGKA